MTHKYSKNKWQKCKKENIVRRPSGLREGPQWEEFNGLM